MTDPRLEKGRQLVRDMFDEKMADALERARNDTAGFAPDAAGFALTNAFADFWTRPGLDRKTRSMITISMIMALRTPNELKNHIRGALNNGCTKQEIEEVLYHGIPYLGFPTVAVAIQAAGEVMEERGITGERIAPEAS